MRKIKIFGLTDIGRIREQNEDNYYIGKYHDMIVATVADGGSAYGEVASQIAVETIERIFEKNRSKLDTRELIEDCFLLSHRRIIEKSKTDYGNVSMGTTCTLVAIARKTVTKKGKNKNLKSLKNIYLVFLGHIGDSKLYLIRNKKIKQKSTDHTMLQRLLDAKVLKPEEEENFAHKNIIYKSVGGLKDLELDPVQEFEIKNGDILLLCSDGLSNYIKPDEMLKIIQSTRDIERAGSYMRDLANFRGGDDNITLILIEKGRYQRTETIKIEKIKQKEKDFSWDKRKPIIFALFVVLMILIAILLFLLINDDDKDMTAYSHNKYYSPWLIADRV